MARHMQRPVHTSFGGGSFVVTSVTIQHAIRSAGGVASRSLGLAILAGAALSATLAMAEGVAASPQDGQRLYDSQCAGCHGATGRGDGPAATLLYPRPRDFVEQPFKLGGAEEDVRRTVTRGIPGTSS